VSVLLGNGDGTFAARVEHATGSQPISVAIGDLNGDTHADLVTANLSASTVSMLLGNGDGTFDPHVDLTAGFLTVSLAIGDLDGDSDADLAVTNASEPTKVAVFLGDGAGGFGPAVQHTTNDFPVSVAIGDLDSDTDADLVTANTHMGSGGSVSVLLGNGDGTFDPRVDYSAGDFANSVAIGDLNGDTQLDVAVAYFGSGTGGVTVRLSNGDGTLAARTDYPGLSGDDPTSVAIGDLNGDSHHDLALASPAGRVLVLLGNGDGSFGPRTTHTATTPNSVAVADLNGDGRADVATASGAVVSVLLNTTAPGAPTIIRNATAGHQQATVSWTAPTSDGGSPVTGYVVTPYIGYYPLPSQSFSSTATTQTVTGLINGTTYRFRVRAMTAFATSGYSKVTNPVTPTQTAPGAPTIGSATAGDQEATVTWTAPASDGGSPITGYVVTPYVGYFPLASQTFGSTATTQVVTGLTNGTQYRFRVQAINAVGTSGYSKVTNPVTPAA